MSHRPLSRPAAAWLLALGAGVAGGGASAQPVTDADAFGGPSARRPAPARVAQANKPESSPTWRELTAAQQKALAPLTGSWSTLSEAHKRKWIAVSANYPSMPPPEQARLHSRMAEWVALSPQQRTVARMNFAETKAVAADDKKAKWEAYQALPPEEKRKLAAGARAAKPAAPTTAAAIQPDPRPKLAAPSTAKEPGSARASSRTPRIAGPADAGGVPPNPDAGPVRR